MNFRGIDILKLLFLAIFVQNQVHNPMVNVRHPKMHKRQSPLIFNI